jgi:ubiquinone/menaquinone biosynthesis C-methylase UbiE
MNKGVDKETFWKRRLDRAKELGELQCSVFEMSREKWDYLAEIHKTIVRRHVKPGDKVLDAGCGYGRASEWVDNYVGVDFSPDFIKEAQTLYPDKKFIQADLKKLPFKDNEFDLAICVSVKQMIVSNLGENDWLKMEKELKRVAKKVLELEYGSLTDWRLL